MKRTSDRVSRIAGSYTNMTAERLLALGPEQAEAVARDVRSMAASLLAQDETRGLRKLWKKVTGS